MAQLTAGQKKTVHILARQGLFVPQIAVRVGVSRSLIVEELTRVGIRYKHQKRTRQEISAIRVAVEDDGLNIRQAAAKLEIPRSTVHRHLVANRGYRNRDANGRLLGATVRKWKCPRHGWLIVRPCVACAALAARG